MKLFGVFERVEPQDDGTVKVFGYASSEAVDSQGETVKASAMLAAMPDYLKFGAVREMHRTAAIAPPKGVTAAFSYSDTRMPTKALTIKPARCDAAPFCTSYKKGASDRQSQGTARTYSGNCARESSAMMTPAAEIRDRWLARRDELRRLNASVDGAALCDEVLADLEKIVSDPAEKPVTVREAAKLSGYSEDHIGRLLREGKLDNVGRKHAPRVMPSALPRRAGLALDHSPRPPYDAHADAQSLRGRR